MALSDHERQLMLTGTFDTSGIGGSPYEELPNVTLAFGKDIPLPDRIVPADEVEAVTLRAPDGSTVEALRFPATPEELEWAAAQVPEAAPAKPAQAKPAPRKRTTKKEG
ncbi:hypothetical protein [Streptomyces albidoflavus]|uniref:hypothetical protein n=1 Tax=Streptomyces albidoflavus TaxID=1886 RepID=UPI0033DA909D